MADTGIIPPILDPFGIGQNVTDINTFLAAVPEALHRSFVVGIGLLFVIAGLVFVVAGSKAGQTAAGLATTIAAPETLIAKVGAGAVKAGGAVNQARKAVS